MRSPNDLTLAMAQRKALRIVVTSSAGDVKYHSSRWEVAAASSFAACRLNGLAVATKMDLLIRSKGATHQRRHTSAGKPRNKSMSAS